MDSHLALDRQHRYRSFFTATKRNRLIIGVAMSIYTLLFPFAIFYLLDELLMKIIHFLFFSSLMSVSLLLGLKTRKLSSGLWLKAELDSYKYFSGFSTMLLVIAPFAISLVIFDSFIATPSMVQFPFVNMIALIIVFMVIALLVYVDPLHIRQGRKFSVMWIRIVWGKMDDVVAAIRSALDSTRTEYSLLSKGSHWLGGRKVFSLGSGTKTIEVGKLDRWDVIVQKRVEVGSRYAISREVDEALDKSLDLRDMLRPPSLWEWKWVR